ncbi:hypothetical protein WJX73_006649 [Symbiochloris irregularis]|uniref:Phytanoyl-CoA dioxygenase n=1 Tax=Symbiochloris irregularis TaxID=706552 RepID=A0AAW1NPG2_9CHLO
MPSTSPAPWAPGVRPSLVPNDPRFDSPVQRSSLAAQAPTLEQPTASPPPKPTAIAQSPLFLKAALDLKQRGWALIDGILSPEDCEQYIQGLWAWLEGLGTGISRDDPNTWKPPHWPESVRGIINSLGVAHEPFVWRVRKHPKLLAVFAALWGTEALLSSFDSINALAPATEPPEVPSNGWLHTDQAPTRRGVCCIQGLVNMVDVGPSSTGTILIKQGSHKHHRRFFDEACQMSVEEQAKTEDWYQFQDGEVPWFDQFETVTPSAPAGSLILWDSRTAHANVLPEKTDQWRHVVYTCYQPASLATEQDLQRKEQAWREYRVTTHWPAQNVSLFNNATDTQKELAA